MELDLQVSPEEIMTVAIRVGLLTVGPTLVERQLGCETDSVLDFFRFELFLNRSSATDIVLVTLPKHGS